MDTTYEFRRKRFQQLVDNFEGKKKDFAAHYELGESYVSQLYNGHSKIGPQSVEKLTKLFGLPPRYFDMSDNEIAGVASSVSDCDPHLQKYENENNVTTTHFRIPLISMTSIIKNRPKRGEYRGPMISVPVAVSETAFAVNVEDDTMVPDFTPGTILTVDPEIDAKHGDLVIAYNKDWEQPTFKKLSIDAGVKLLIPLNPAYPPIPITQDTNIIGTIVSSTKIHKRE